jgi:hypothetical protein
MKTPWLVITLSLCAGCLIDREIGAGLDPRNRAPAGTAPGQTAPMQVEPPPASRGSCCTLGPQMALDDPESQASPPSIAWDGASWAVAFSNFLDHNRESPVIRLVQGDLPGMRFDVAWPITRPTAIGYHDGVYALALVSTDQSRWPEDDRRGWAVAVDAQGMERASGTLEPMDGGAAVVRAIALGAWAFVVYDDRDGGRSGNARLVLLDEQMAPLAQQVLGIAIYGDYLPVTVLSLEDKVITVVPTAGGVQVRTFVGRALAEPHPGLVVQAGTTTGPSVPRGRDGLPLDSPVGPVASIAAAVVRDRVVIAAMDRQTVRTWSYQPASGGLLAGPTVVGSSTDNRLGIGGDSGGGSAGICFSVGHGPGDASGFQFALVGPDGSPRGLPVTIASGLRYAASCDVAAGVADEYLVALWNAGKDLGETRPSILATRVQVQRARPIVVE